MRLQCSRLQTSKLCLERWSLARQWTLTAVLNSDVLPSQKYPVVSCRQVSATVVCRKVQCQHYSGDFMMCKFYIPIYIEYLLHNFEMLHLYPNFGLSYKKKILYLKIFLTQFGVCMLSTAQTGNWLILCLQQCVHMATPSLILIGRLRD